jgi:hypothetical protein
MAWTRAVTALSHPTPIAATPVQQSLRNGRSFGDLALLRRCST